MDIYYFNDFLKKTRLKRGLTQQQFADALGITKQAVSAIEAYKNKVSHEVIEVFCNQFEYRVYFQNFKDKNA
jgi:transcriptional regulator with XRE-family HTH domain